MKTFLSLLTISFLIAVTTMAAPKKANEECSVKQLSLREQGFSMDQAKLQCGEKLREAFIFSESQVMLLEMAYKKNKVVKVGFEKMDRKRVSISEVEF